MTRKRAIDLTGADGLDNEKRVRLLGIIDRLRELGISENVSLPQLVPGPKTKNLEDVEKTFSDDILKVELSGPDHRHLSVVDVPGLFHKDRAIVRKLIKDYMTNKRTIILAVMDARNNLANQEVFSMTRAADPAGKRTVGIVTKCDALQAGDEAGVLRIAKNEVEHLTHEWFAVRNRSTQEIKEGVSIEGRHQREQAFFSTIQPWTGLRKDRVDIKALKSFLGHLLYDHIRSEFPAVVADIEKLFWRLKKNWRCWDLPVKPLPSRGDS
ncbi:hypothetical protein N7451_012487 [Penicillium sp. IBT 35674x]|nr:hypothetical protein N7451_012487 [Penicillium sp. IBT 35674x]